MFSGVGLPIASARARVVGRDANAIIQNTYTEIAVITMFAWANMVIIGFFKGVRR